MPAPEMEQQPTHVTFGDPAGRTAIVFSPILPAWDEGAFCGLLLSELLEYGYCIHVYDSLSLTKPGTSFAATVDVWDTALRERHQQVDLAVGQAYGGALVQSLLGKVLAHCPHALGLSAPTIATETLRFGLDSILAELRQHGPAAGLSALEQWVRPEGAKVPEIREAPPNTAARLKLGFEQLRNLDARNEVEHYGGRLLLLYGEASRLVNRHCISVSRRHTGQLCIGLSGCAMRPLVDTPEIALGLIRHFLH